MVVASDTRLEEHKVGGGGPGGGGGALVASSLEFQLQMPCGGREEQPLAAPPEHHCTSLTHACLASDSSLQVAADVHFGRSSAACESPGFPH